MKKANVLSKAEMRNVMGGRIASSLCLKECSFGEAEQNEPCPGGGTCTYYAATAECPAGQQACIA